MELEQGHTSQRQAEAQNTTERGASPYRACQLRPRRPPTGRHTQATIKAVRQGQNMSVRRATQKPVMTDDDRQFMRGRLCQECRLRMLSLMGPRSKNLPRYTAVEGQGA